MSYHYEKKLWEQVIRQQIDASIFWNAHPIDSPTIDLYTAVNHISLIARSFRRKLLENQNFSTDTKVLFRSTDRIKPIYFDIKNQVRTKGQNPFGFGYPLFIARSKKDPTRTIAAPLFVWYLDIMPDVDKHDKWQLVHDADFPVVPNYYLLDYWEQEYNVDFKSDFEAFAKQKEAAFDNMKPLMEKICQLLDIDNMRPPNGIKATPMKKEYAKVADTGTMYWSGVLGAFPMQQLDSLQRISEKEEVPNEEFAAPKALEINHSFGLNPGDPNQLEVLESYPNHDINIINGADGTGKTQTLQNIAINLLSNGHKVLFLSENAASINEMHTYLKSNGLDNLVLKLTDPIRDKNKLLRKVFDLSRQKSTYGQFDQETFKRALSNSKREKQKLDQQFSALKKTKFGPFQWTDIVGLFLTSNKIEGREVMDSQFKVADFNFTYQEYSILKKDLAISERLFRQLETIDHPLSKLHENNYKVAEPAFRKRRELDNKIQHFLQKIGQLKYQYQFQLENYKAQLSQHFHRCAEEVQVKLDQYKINLNNYTGRFGTSFEGSNTPLKVFSVFSNKHKNILESKAKLSREYQALTKFAEAKKMFNFPFLDSAESKNVRKVKKSIINYEKEMHSWLGNLSNVLDKTKHQLNSQNSMAVGDFKDQLIQLEAKQKVIIDQVNLAKLYQQEYQSEQTTLMERIKEMETITADLEATRLSLNDFEPYYNWQHYWLSMPDSSKSVINALIKNNPDHWGAAFESWYLHQYLKLNYDNSPIPEEVSSTAYLKAMDRLRTYLPKQIEHHWGKRQNRSFLKQLMKNNQASLKEIIQMEFEAVGNFFPIVLATPEAASTLFLDHQFECLLIDDGHQLPVPKAIAIKDLSHKLIVTGDPNRKHLSQHQNFFEDLVSQGHRQYNLEYQHLRRPLKLLQFANVAFGQQLNFVNKGAQLFPQEALALNTHGTYNKETKINDEECANVIGILLNTPPLPDHNTAKVSVVAFSQAQRDLIADRILELSQVKDEDGAKIQRLHQHGLAVYYIGDFDAIKSDIVIASLGYSQNEEESQEDFVLLKNGKGLDYINLLCSGNYHQLILCHSLSNELLQSWRDQADQKGTYILSHFIAYLRALETNDLATQDIILDRVNENKETIHSDHPFLEEVARALSPYFEADRIKQNITISNTTFPLIILPKDSSQLPWVIQADGSLWPSSTSAYEWEAQAQETIAFLGLNTKNLWSVEWWKSPQQSARVLASELIKNDNIEIQ